MNQAHFLFLVIFKKLKNSPLIIWGSKKRGFEAPSSVTAKGLEGDVKFGRAGYQQGTRFNGEIIQI